MAAPTIQIKRGLLANLPGLKVGEPGFTTNTYDLYVGLDGTSNNNKFFGSHRYWTKETATVGSSVKIVEATNNGTNFVALKSPDLLSQDYTYTLPSTYGTNGFVLQSDGAGGLTWASALAASGAISGITVREEGTVVGTAGTVTSINFVGEGIVATASGIGATITLGAASATVAGVSSYNSSDFYFANTYQVGITTATTSTKGIASFSSTNFTVTAGAVSIAANAVGLGTNTYGQYAKSITGGSGLTATAAGADDGTDYTVALKNAASLSSNTLTKWDSGNTQLTNSSITDSGTLVSVNSNLYVSGTLSIGGTSVFINAGTLQVKDRDIVLGITTDGSGNDISTDLSATHGGVSIASTQGSPLFNMPQLAGINSNPFTYKQFMWISSATGASYAGVGTDAWISNYAIGIGTLTVRNGSRLTVGAGFTVFDTYLDAQDIRSKNISNTGFVTTTSLKTTNLYDSTNTNGTSGQFLTVTGAGIGWTTISGVTGGTISTATRAQTIDSVATPGNTGTYYPALFSSSSAGLGVTAYVDGGVSFDAATDSFTLTGNIAINGGTVTTTGTAATIFNTNATTVNAFGAATTLNIGASSGTLTLRNPTVIGSTTSLDLYNTVATTVNAFGAGTAINIGAATGITTFRNSVRVTNSLYDSTNSAGISGQYLTVTGAGIGWTTISGVAAGGIATATRANSVDVAATNAQSGGLVFATAGNGATLYNDADLTYNSATNALVVTNVQHSTVKALDGTSAITIANTTGAVGIASDLTVSGNLYIAGTATQVNTTNLVVEDRVIELGKVQGTPPTDTTWDLGILFNYYTASSNKKASVYWEGGVSRFLFASDVSESVLGINLPDTGAVGLGTTTPQLTSPVFAPIEVGALWMNDTAGQSVVASYLALNGLYTGAPADRYLQNITVDAGIF